MSAQFNFIDLIDCIEVYIDFISSSVNGLRYIASISDQQEDLQSIITTLENSTDNIKKLMDQYLKMYKGGDHNG